MAFDAFLKVDGIPGESTDQVHKGEIDLISFSWGEMLPAVQGNAFGRGSGAGRISFQDFHFSMAMSKASPLLFQACATGKHIPTVTLSCRKAGGDQQTDFLKIDLQNVLVSSYQTGGELLDTGGYSPLGAGDNEVPLDQFTLTFQKIDFNVGSAGSPAGTPDGAAASASFDLGAGRSS